ncbi:MAG TPA: hypothetical protein VHC46_04760 [Thermodesulfobacteriota bacterium]|nr:hypothetical protein [Candidatus Paceibacterota bacterium]HVY55047.1 hypothetical protein [Thermodesulfobacteriota bacterium]
MIFKFLRTKIGVATLVAALLIVGAVVIKTKSSAKASTIQEKVGLIADASVKQGIANGEPSNLDIILGTSTIEDKIAVLETRAATETPEKLTATDRFARAFFQEYVNLKNSGAQIDENTGTDLVNRLLERDYGSPTEEKTYTESDIAISSSISSQSLKQYGNKLGAILEEPLPKGYEQELYIIARYNDTEDVSELPKLAQNIAHYTSLRNKILALSVPNPLKAAHIALLNSISAILEGVRGMTYMDSDPVGATKMISRYNDGIESVTLPLAYIKSYFKKQSISFSSSESGYILMQ